MRSVLVRLLPLSVGALVLCPTSVVAGQGESARSSPPAQNATDVQQVRDELARLKREFEVLRRQYDERLVALEERLAQIAGPVAGNASAGAAAGPAEGTTVPQDPPAQGRPPTPTPAGPKALNPDISVNGNVLGALAKDAPDLAPLQLSEVEAAFQAIIDPYAKADFFVAFGPEGADVEEAYITFTALPANLLLKAGKMRALFGKVNTLHTHALPSADRPLVTANLLGGDEGLSDAGLSLSHLIANPLVYLEVVGEVYRGESEVFQSDARSRLAYVGRARAYRDITESTNIDLGTSVAFGRAGVGVGEDGAFQSVHNRRLVGVDATFRYRPLRRAIYQRLNLRTELVWSRQELPTDPAAQAFGFYALGEYQFARRWYLGGRLDRSGRAQDPSAVDRAQSVFLTFWPTEFSQVRGQYRRLSFAEGVTSHQLLFQFKFSIGAHAAHVF